MKGTDARGYDNVRPIGWDGLIGSEREILALRDGENLSVTAIADRTGYDRIYVRDTLMRFGVTALEPWHVDAARGSAALVAALARHFPQLAGGAAR